MIVGELVSENAVTGLKAIFVGDKYITIFNKKGVSVRATTVKNADVMMYRYGKSKVMHWNDCCAKPNAHIEPSKIRLLDGLLEGHSVCKNCWGRTRSFQRESK